MSEMFFVTDERASAERIDATVTRIESDCAGSTRLVDSAAVLFERGHDVHAERLLREAVEREPESFSAWAGLATALAKRDPEGAREAAAHARSLNSQYRPPA